MTYDLKMKSQSFSGPMCPGIDFHNCISSDLAFLPLFAEAEKKNMAGVAAVTFCNKNLVHPFFFPLGELAFLVENVLVVFHDN